MSAWHPVDEYRSTLLVNVQRHKGVKCTWHKDKCHYHRVVITVGNLQLPTCIDPIITQTSIIQASKGEEGYLQDDEDDKVAKRHGLLLSL